MKNLKQITLVLAIIAAFVITGCNNSGGKKASEKEIIKIGAILPLTGAGSEFAQYIKEGIELAVIDVNKDSTIQLQILYEDSKTQPKEGVSAFNKLLTTQKPLASIVALSSVARATQPIARDNNALVIYTAVAIPNVADGKNTFRLYPEALGMSGVMARYNSETLKAKTAAVIYINDDFGRSSLEVYKNEFAKYGGEVIFSESYEMMESDYKNQIAKLRSLTKQPDVIYLNGYGPAYAMILRQLKENKVKSIITADMTMGLPNTLKIVGDLANDIYYVDGVMNDIFIEKYTTIYSKQPTSYSGYAYDIVMMLYQILKSSNNRSTDELAESLRKLNNYEGAMGNIKMQESGDANLQFVVKKIVNGKPELIK